MAGVNQDVLQRALLESKLKYGAQGSALAQLLSSTAQSYDRTRKTNASNARAQTSAALVARPQVTGNYDQALQTAQAQEQGLGTTGNPEAQAFARRVAESKANALQDLTQRQLQAQDGQVQANNQARSQYFGDKGNILGQIADLAKTSGLDTSVTYGNLLDAASKQALDQSSLDERVRHDQATESISQQNATARAKAKASVKWAAPATQAAAKDSLDSALGYVQQMTQAGLPVAKVRQILQTGELQQPKRDSKGNVLVDAAGKTVYETVKHPTYSKDFVDAALAIAAPDGPGALTAANVKALHNRGIRVDKLGFPTLASAGGKKASRVKTKADLVSTLKALAGAPSLKPLG